MPASADRAHPPASGVEELDADTCWQLLELGAIGRLAVTGHDGAPDVMPINYLVHERALFFRTAPGGKLRSIDAHPKVAFEIDGHDAASRWSVVVRGTARVLSTRSEIEASGVARLMSWSPTQKDHFVRLSPRTVSGRRFPRRHGARPLVVSGVAEVTADAQELSSLDGVLPKPSPIPHRPPRRDAD